MLCYFVLLRYDMLCYVVLLFDVPPGPPSYNAKLCRVVSQTDLLCFCHAWDLSEAAVERDNLTFLLEYYNFQILSLSLSRFPLVNAS